MRHRKKVIKLGRKTAHRKAMLANMASSLIEHKRINSTLTKVKAGTPVKVIKVWKSNESSNWLLVSVLCQNFDQLFYRRGWVEI